MTFIGVGANEHVIRVKNETTDEDKAVKLVRKYHVSVGEMEIWQSLDHDHILKLLSFEYVYQADSYLFFTDVHSKTLEGVILESLLESDPIAYEDAVKWLKDILQAICYLHQRDLAHLDLKPNNVLFSEENRAILVDFGFLASCEKPVKRY